MLLVFFYSFTAVATFLFVAGINLGLVVVSRKLHTSMLKTIMRQPMNFFDTTPLGRVMNRFSRDVDTIDAQVKMKGFKTSNI